MITKPRNATEDLAARRKIGRLINVVLTAPMLEELARVAQDTGAAYYVEITNPTARLYEPTIELGPLEDGESPCGPSL